MHAFHQNYPLQKTYPVEVPKVGHRPGRRHGASCSVEVPFLRASGCSKARTRLRHGKGTHRRGRWHSAGCPVEVRFHGHRPENLFGGKLGNPGLSYTLYTAGQHDIIQGLEVWSPPPPRRDWESSALPPPWLKLQLGLLKFPSSRHAMESCTQLQCGEVNQKQAETRYKNYTDTNTWWMDANPYTQPAWYMSYLQWNLQTCAFFQTFGNVVFWPGLTGA